MWCIRRHNLMILIIPPSNRQQQKRLLYIQQSFPILHKKSSFLNTNYYIILYIHAINSEILLKGDHNMDNIKTHIKEYLNFCTQQKRLDKKTLKAYRTDLKQFNQDYGFQTSMEITSDIIETYITNLHAQYKPKTVKRKLASLKAFFRYLEYKDYIDKNPFNKIQLKFREPFILPKTIPLHTIELLLSTIYKQQETAKTPYQKKNALRDAAIIELLFSTGIRISELCSLHLKDVDIQDQTILIYGKGSKERRLLIGNDSVIRILKEYKTCFRKEIEKCTYFFCNQNGTRLSDQSVRRAINKYCTIAGIVPHITPHMFRHTFATSLLEADVDIRYIQEMLGHSSITVTEIYTHVTIAKQKDILTTKHPRKDFNI